MYRKRVWRYVSASQYGSSSAWVKPELSSFTVGTCTVLSGETVVPKIIAEDDDTPWVDPEDFIYSGFNSTEVYCNSVSGTFTGISTSSNMYTSTVIATHKVTGRTANFTMVTNPKAFLFAVEPEDDRDRTSWIQGTAGYIEDVGISEAEEYYGSFTKAETINKLKNDQYCIFVSNSHGGYLENTAGSMADTRIITNEFEDTGVDYYLCAQDLVNLANNDLTNLKLALFIGCKTAGPLSTVKLPLTVVGKGATTAIGFEDTIYNDNANDWVEEFFKKLEQGSSVYDACNELREYAWYNAFGLDKFVIYGDSQLTFK